MSIRQGIGENAWWCRLDRTRKEEGSAQENKQASQHEATCPTNNAPKGMPLLPANGLHFSHTYSIIIVKRPIVDIQRDCCSVTRWPKLLSFYLHCYVGCHEIDLVGAVGDELHCLCLIGRGETPFLKTLLKVLVHLLLVPIR